MPTKEEITSLRIGQNTSRLPNWLIAGLGTIISLLVAGAFYVGSFKSSTEQILGKNSEAIAEVKLQLDKIQDILFKMSVNRDNRFNALELEIDKHVEKEGHPHLEKRVRRLEEKR